MMLGALRVNTARRTEKLARQLTAAGCTRGAGRRGPRAVRAAVHAVRGILCQQARHLRRYPTADVGYRAPHSPYDSEHGRQLVASSHWAAFTEAEPALARIAEERFGAFTHHVLATLRKDGSPAPPAWRSVSSTASCGSA